MCVCVCVCVCVCEPTRLNNGGENSRFSKGVTWKKERNKQTNKQIGFFSLKTLIFIISSPEMMQHLICWNVPTLNSKICQKEFVDTLLELQWFLTIETMCWVKLWKMWSNFYESWLLAIDFFFSAQKNISTLSYQSILRKTKINDKKKDLIKF